MGKGEVEASYSGTIQMKQFHPIQCSIAVRLPIEDGETVQQAVARVNEIAKAEFDEKFLAVISEGWKWGLPGNPGR